MNNNTVGLTAHINVDQDKMSEAERKAARLSELLEEASSLARELASMEITVSVDVL